MKSTSNCKSRDMLLSVFLAFLFWLYIIDVEDPEQSEIFREVPISLSGENILESQNLTVTNISQQTVDLEIRAPVSALNTLRNSPISVTVDVSKFSMGETAASYTVVLPNSVNSNNLMIEQRLPAQITVEVGRLYSETLPIGVQMRGSVAEGYQAGQFTMSPEVVTLNGSVEEVSKVDRVVIILEQENMSQRFSGELPLVMLDAQGNEITDVTIDLSEDSAYVTLPIVMEREIPLVVNYIPGGGATESHIESVTFTPATITVSGAEEDMIGLKEISLGSVDLSLVTEKDEFTFPIALDSSLVNVSGITEASVSVQVAGLATEIFDVTNIELVNCPEGYVATTTTKMRTVVVRGSEEDLEQIDVSQLRIVADLANMTASGSSAVPVKVYLDSAGDVGVTGEYTIVVNMSKT